MTDVPYSTCTWKNLKTQSYCTNFNDEENKVCKINIDTWLVENRIVAYKEKDNECTLRISQAQIEDSSQWKCFVFGKDEGKGSVEATINVTIFWSTKPSFRTRPHRVFTEGIIHFANAIETQCGNGRILLSFRFYMKIKIVIFTCFYSPKLILQKM